MGKPKCSETNMFDKNLQSLTIINFLAYLSVTPMFEHLSCTVVCVREDTAPLGVVPSSEDGVARLWAGQQFYLCMFSSLFGLSTISGFSG